MPLKEITYSKKFPYAQFLNYDIGYVWTLADGESQEDIEEKLFQMAESTHKKRCPEFYQQPEAVKTVVKEVEIRRRTPEEQKEHLIQSINGATTLQELKAYKLLASQSGDTLDIYTQREISLSA